MSITRLTTNGLTGTKYDIVSADNYYMEPIATTLIGAGGATSIDFTNIPNTYKHLQIRWLARTNRATNPDYFNMRFNSDTSSSYSAHLLSGNGSTASASAYTTQAQIYLDGAATGAGQTSGVFAVGVIDILDYSNVYKNKTTRHLLGYDNNGSGVVYLSSGLWMNTAPISTVTLTSGSSSTIQQHTRISLYGIKG